MIAPTENVKSTHTAHDAEDVVVSSIDTNLAGTSVGNGGTAESELESGVVNAGHVASSRGLVLLGLQAEGVHVNTNGGAVGVVLEGLNQVEVATITLSKPVVAVELELGAFNGVVATVKEAVGGGNTDLVTNGISGTVNEGSTAESIHSGLVDKVGNVVGNSDVSNTSSNIETSIKEVVGISSETSTETVLRNARERSDIKGIGVVEPLATHVGSTGGGISVGIRLDDPDEFLNGVVKVELDLVGGGVDGLITSELELLNKVLVGGLSEAAALISVKVDVVNPETGSNEGRSSEGSVISEVALVGGTELKVNLDLVVLEGNEGESKTGVAAEPELEGDVESGLGHLTSSATDGLDEAGNVANHGGITTGVTSGLGKLVPDVEPVTVVTVNALTTDLNLNLLDEDVTEPVQPAETFARSESRNTGESDLEVHTGDEITIAGNGAGHLAAEVSRTVEGLFDGLHGEVCMTLVSDLPESNLGITSKVNVLSAIGDELHKTTTHCKGLCFIYYQ